MIKFLSRKFNLKVINPKEMLEQKLRNNFNEVWKNTKEKSVNNPLYWRDGVGFSSKNIQNLGTGKEIEVKAAMTLAFEGMGMKISLKPSQLPSGMDYTSEELSSRFIRVKNKKVKKSKEEPIDFGIEGFIPERAEPMELIKLLEEEEQKMEQEEDLEEGLDESEIRKKEEKKEQERDLLQRQRRVWEVRVSQGWEPLKGFLFVDFPKKQEDVKLLKKLGLSFDQVVELNQADEGQEDHEEFPLGSSTEELHQHRNEVTNFLLLSEHMAHLSPNLFNRRERFKRVNIKMSCS